MLGIHPRLLFAFALPAFACIVPPAGADGVFWKGNFEDEGFSAWTDTLNSRGIERNCEHAAEGDCSARIVIRGEPDYWWNDNPALNRVELQYKPPDERTAPGTEVFFGWSFMIPRPLSDDRHEFGYWESQGSYRQTMRFNLRGTTVGFQFTGRESETWTAADALVPGQWHDLAMHVRWSTRPDAGFVTVWFDGERVVERQHGPTLFSADEPMFIQIGLLRNAGPTVEEVYIDNAREAADVHGLSTARPATGEKQPRPSSVATRPARTPSSRVRESSE